MMGVGRNVCKIIHSEGCLDAYSKIMNANLGDYEEVF